MKIKKLRLIIIIIVTCGICLCTFNWIAKANGYESLLNVFFSEKEKELIDREMLVSNGQVLIIDDYEITLCEELFDAVNNVGYCEFNVVKNDGKDKAEYPKKKNNGADYKSFGEEGRFIFQVGVTSSFKYNLSFKEEGNTLHMYMHFSISADEYDNRLYIFDVKSGKEPQTKNCSGYFQLISSGRALVFKVSESETVYISPFAIQYISTKEIDESEISITIILKDETKKEIIDSGNTDGSIKSNSYSYDERVGNHCYKYEFENIYNIDNILSIDVNGKSGIQAGEIE